MAGKIISRILSKIISRVTNNITSKTQVQQDSRQCDTAIQDYTIHLLDKVQ
jgi:hypothetical protein